MKDVCQQTGLTDRTVRYYIECGLLTPNSKDNYAGRKNYTFTREDVERLEQIKTLRSAGFGVEHIKMLLGGQSTREIVSDRLQELETEREKSEQLLDALQKANIDRDVSLEELTIILSNHPTQWEEEKIEDRFPYWVFLAVSFIVELLLFWLDHTRYEWMITVEQTLWLDVACVVGLVALFKRSNWKRYSVIVGVCVIMPLVSVVSGLFHHPAMMNDSHYALIDQIPWDNTLYLQRHGFEKQGGSGSKLDYDIRTLFPDKEDKRMLHFTLTVEHLNMEDLSKFPVQHYGDSYIFEDISAQYDSFITEWFRCPRSVSRSYWIASKGKEITLWDWADETPKDMDAVECVLNNLAGDIAQIGVVHKPDENAAAVVNGVSISNDAVEERLLLNQLRNRAFTDLYKEVYPNEIDREYYMQKSLRADDREGVIEELIRFEVIRGLLAKYDKVVSYEDAVTAYDAEYLQMRKDESQHAFYEALQNAMSVYSVEEEKLITMSYALKYDSLNELALKRWFSKSAFYIGGYSSLTEQFEEYVDSWVELAEITIL